MSSIGRRSSSVISLSSFNPTDTSSDYDFASSTERGSESRFSAPETEYSHINRSERDAEVNGRRVRCRVQWLGAPTQFLTVRTLGTSELAVTQVGPGKPSESFEWLLNWRGSASECTIQPLSHDALFIGGPQLVAQATPLSLCRVSPPPSSAAPCAWEDVEEEWACLITFPSRERLSALVHSAQKQITLAQDSAPVTKNDIWRIQILQEGRNPVMPVGRAQTALVNPPVSPLVPTLPSELTSPVSAGMRCHLVGYSKGAKPTYLQVDAINSPIGIKVSQQPKPTEWIITPYGGYYTIQLAKDATYLSANSQVLLWRIPAKWRIVKLPREPLASTKTQFGAQWTCTIHPASQGSTLLRFQGTKPIISQIPAAHNLGSKHKWHIFFLGDKAHSNPGPSSERESGNKPQLASSSLGSANTPSVASSTQQEVLPSPPVLSTFRPLTSIAITRDSQDDSPYRVLNWVHRHASVVSEPTEPTPQQDDGTATPQPREAPITTPKSDREETSNVVEEQSSSLRDESIERTQAPEVTHADNIGVLPHPVRTCRVQHVLTGKYLLHRGDEVGLGELNGEDVWVLQPAGPGYNLVVPALEQSAQKRYLAPTPGHGDSQTLLSTLPYPATWDISQQHRRYTANPDVEMVEWVCKIRWPFGGHCISAESTVNIQGKSEDKTKNANFWVWLSKARENDVDGLARLGEFWRVQFLI